MADIELIITATEYEALLLENNLIKQWRPKYNINLKDGKTYPVIRITAEEFPRVFRTRRIVFDGSEYFGPYPKPQADRHVPAPHREVLPPAQATGAAEAARRTPASTTTWAGAAGPCAGKIDRARSTHEIVDEVRKLLSGRSEELVARARARRCSEASGSLDFERAARLRDQVAAIEEVSVEQRVMEFTEEDRDYVALAASGEALVIVVLQVRDGKLLGKEVFQVSEWAPDEEALSHFIGRYYGERKSVPGRGVRVRARGGAEAWRRS